MMNRKKTLWAAIALAMLPSAPTQAEESVIRVYSSTIEDRFGEDTTQPSSSYNFV